MAERNKINVQVILDFNSNKLFAQVAKEKKTFLIDLDGIAKDELTQINNSVKALQKKNKEADVSQYEHLMQARIYRKINYHLKEYFAVDLSAKKYNPAKFFIDLIVVQPFNKDKSVSFSMTDIEIIGVIKLFFAGTKGIKLSIVKEAPKYNIKK